MRQRKRLIIIALGIFFLFSLLIATFFKIQILEGERWRSAALAQHECIIQEPFKRGAFYSNQTLSVGHPETIQPLVLDVTKFHLFIDPLSIPTEYHDEMILFLRQHLLIKEEEFKKKSRSRRIALWLDREVKETILAWWTVFAKERKIACNALYFVTDNRRSYPYGKLLGQVLHTIRELKDEKTREGLPTGGLEAYFNDYLKGKLGKRKLLRSPLNQLEIDKVIEEPEDGADIYLTVNHYIQAIAEEELEKGVLAAQAKGGWAVMLNPYNGEILALAQYPFFDPSCYQEYFNDPLKIEDAKVKAVTDAFELGSIMKPITLAIALKANIERKKEGKGLLFDPLGKIDVTRSIFPGRASRPLYDLPHHKALNLYMALQKSSNVYMAQLVDLVINAYGNEWYRNALVDIFGFQKKTGIEIPGEAYGLVPCPGKIHPSGALEWSLPTPYSLAIGYNILATSLQMARAYAIIANGGFFIEPTLIRKIVKKDQVLIDKTVLPPKKRVLEAEITEEVIKGMKFSTQEGGTGKLGSVSGYTEAGKTGTAEKIIHGVYSKKNYISSFIGFTPAHQPRFVLIVTIDEPNPIRIEGGIKNYLGGRCAAPIFSEIAKRTLDYLGEPLDDPHGYPAGDPRYDPQKADWKKEVSELKMLYEKWNKSWE
ncbi:MAG: penicillin-binding protein 2 [Chlamydiales bacterium]